MAVSAEALAGAWLEFPVGRIPLLPEEMDRLRGRIETDDAVKAAWEDTCAVADAFLAEEPGPLVATPLSEYHDNPEATVNNNRAARFTAGWSACAWKAALAEDGAALERAGQCLEVIVRAHGENNGVRIIPGPESPPYYAYYIATRSFEPELLIGRVELMRSAGYADRGTLAGLVERLVFLAALAAEGCEALHERDETYWNGDACCGAGLIAIAAVLPGHPDAGRWEALGWQSLAEYFGERNVLPDGSFHEAFPWAEGYGLEFLFSALEILRGRRELDVPGLRLSPTRTLKEAIQWQIDVASPLGELPCINDTNAYDICTGGYTDLPVLGQWAGIPEVWTAFRTEDYRLPLHVYAHRPEEVPEFESKSLLLPDVGWSFIRSGKGREAFQAMFDHGRHRTGHCMPQCLTFDLTCHGRHWVVNSGGAPHYSTYDEQDTWHRRTRAANCVEVDGEDMAKVDGELLEWTQEDDRVIVRARHRGYETVLHERTLIHREGGPMLVIDQLLPEDGQGHAAKAFWHVNGQVQDREDGRWVFTAGDGLSLLLLSDALGRETPMDEGLCGGLGRRSGGPAKLPTVALAKPGDPGWVFVPYLALDLEVPPEGKQLVTAFVPLKDGGEEEWTLEVTDGSAVVRKQGEAVLSA